MEELWLTGLLFFRISQMTEFYLLIHSGKEMSSLQDRTTYFWIIFSFTAIALSPTAFSGNLLQIFVSLTTPIRWFHYLGIPSQKSLFLSSSSILYQQSSMRLLNPQHPSWYPSFSPWFVSSLIKLFPLLLPFSKPLDRFSNILVTLVLSDWNLWFFSDL